MSKWTPYWVVRFNTGGYGNRYPKRQEAQEYADAANRYSERTQGERAVVALERYDGSGELVQTVPA